jgi:hypothetical protein
MTVGCDATFLDRTTPGSSTSGRRRNTRQLAGALPRPLQDVALGERPRDRASHYGPRPGSPTRTSGQRRSSQAARSRDAGHVLNDAGKNSVARRLAVNLDFANGPCQPLYKANGQGGGEGDLFGVGAGAASASSGEIPTVERTV